MDSVSALMRLHSNRLVRVWMPVPDLRPTPIYTREEWWWLLYRGEVVEIPPIGSWRQTSNLPGSYPDD
jgi:hypothetical protein